MRSFNQSEVERIFLSAPFTVGLGIRLESVAAGECRTSLDLAERHLQQDGFVHAGVQATLADTTAGAAGATLIGPGQYVLSAEFKINLLRPAKGSRLTCVAKVLKAGSTLTVVESEVFCGTAAESRLVSKATVTLAIVSPRAPAGPADSCQQAAEEA
jgi:uncharacterized protein (TIGR00369 family)